MSSTPCSTGDRSLGDSSPPPEEAPLSTTEEVSPSHAGTDRAADHGGEFAFDPDLEHHDPVVSLTEAYERGDLTASLLEQVEVEALKRFVVRAETGSFEVEVPEALAEIVEDHRSDVEVILKVPETPGSTPGEDI